MNELENLHQPYGETWHFRRRVPEHVRKYDKRTEIKSTLKTKDLSVAIAKRDLINAELDKIWNSLLIEEEQFTDPKKEYHQILELCRNLGIKYLENKELVNNDVSELVKRLEIVEEHFHSKPVAKAALGLVKRPAIKLDDAYETHLKVRKSHLQGKSEDFIRKWKNPKKRAIRHFKEACGNPSIFDIDFGMGLQFRDWWLERIEFEGLQGSTANKDFSHLWSIIKDACLVEKVQMDNPFKNCKLSETDNQRPAFETNDIFQIINFKGLMKEHPSFRELILGMAEQGCRDSEIIGLDPQKDVILDGDIPYLDITPNRFRDLKNKPSKRRLPLVGHALDIARETRFKNLDIYKHSPDQASTKINKYLRAAGLLPSEKHTLYSFRHSFKDRLDAVETPEIMVKELMGHTKGKVKYGAGTTLEHRSVWLDKISLKEMVKTRN